MEVQIFLAACLLLMIQQLVGAALKILQSDVGFAWGIGPRDDNRANGILAGRAERATSNMLATFPIFVGLVCLLVVTGNTNEASETGAVIYLSARVAFFLIYLFVTVPMVRTIAWGISIGGLIRMALQLATGL